MRLRTANAHRRRREFLKRRSWDGQPPFRIASDIERILIGFVGSRYDSVTEGRMVKAIFAEEAERRK